MPRRKSLEPTTEVKAYISQANFAKVALIVHNPERGRAHFGSVSALMNEALAYYFSDERKEFLAWKASKQQPDSASCETKPNEAKS
jgi:hypothetical protein